MIAVRESVSSFSACLLLQENLFVTLAAYLRVIIFNCVVMHVAFLLKWHKV